MENSGHDEKVLFSANLDLGFILIHVEVACSFQQERKVLHDLVIHYIEEKKLRAA